MTRTLDHCTRCCAANMAQGPQWRGCHKNCTIGVAAVTMSDKPRVPLLTMVHYLDIEVADERAQGVLEEAGSVVGDTSLSLATTAQRAGCTGADTGDGDPAVQCSREGAPERAGRDRRRGRCHRAHGLCPQVRQSRRRRSQARFDADAVVVTASVPNQPRLDVC